MCEIERATGRPHWGWLYGATLVPLTAFAFVEAVTFPTLPRIVLRGGLLLAMLAGTALWLRANRAAVDLQQWCDCAPRTMMIRVIESRRPEPPGRVDPADPMPAEADEGALVA
jgi:hypothetical protein